MERRCVSSGMLYIPRLAETSVQWMGYPMMVQHQPGFSRNTLKADFKGVLDDGRFLPLVPDVQLRGYKDCPMRWCIEARIA